MPRIYLCFVWHMHQPCYKDLVSGEYRLPWTRMHALKDYYGMVKVLEEFPSIHQTFNLVPSLLAQVEEYAEGKAVDPFLRVALKPAGELSEDEIRFILTYFFQANPIHLIGRYPRYADLHDAWLAADRNFRRAQHIFNAQALCDLQVLSQLAWFDEEFIDNDLEVDALVRKGSNYSLEDQARMGRKQLEILGKVIPIYREFAGRGQIEISATPFYHPILPLLCDSNIARVSNPHVPLPSRFRYPGDARLQLERAMEYVTAKMGAPPVGLWPSEGSVSDEALGIAASVGFQWAATDNGVLARTLERPADPSVSYKPYQWQRDGHKLNMIFRDHYLSDLVGFVYSRMHAEDAASDFVHRIEENCRPILAAGRDALVPIILDGENAWEHYYRNGRPFLRCLYRQISAHPKMTALTVSEAFERLKPEPLDHIWPGSWIGANFDVWIGFDEDNEAWELLRAARDTYEQEPPGRVPETDRKLALEELLIAEGSDWNWWYGPHHDSDNRIEFDQLYRDHLANVYRLLKLTPPTALSRSILDHRVEVTHYLPVAPLSPVIDGEVTSYFEWMGSGVYRVNRRSGSMHGQRFLVKELAYGVGEQRLFLRVDFVEEEQSLAGMEVRLVADGRQVRLRLGERSAEILESACPGVIAAFHRILEVSLPFDGKASNIELSLWQDGLPMDSLPQEGSLRIAAGVDPSY